MSDREVRLENLVVLPIVRGFSLRRLSERGAIQVVDRQRWNDSSSFIAAGRLMISDVDPCYELQKNDILLTRMPSFSNPHGSLKLMQWDDGKHHSVIVPTPYTFSENLILVRPDASRIVPSFLRHYLAWYGNNYGIRRFLVRRSSGVDIDSRALSNINVWVPSMKTQRRIVDILEKPLRLHMLRNESKDKVWQLKRACFERIFGDPHFISNDFPERRLDEIVSISDPSSGVSDFFIKTGMPNIAQAYLGVPLRNDNDDLPFYNVLSVFSPMVLPEFLVDILNMTRLFHKSFQKSVMAGPAGYLRHRITVPPVELQEKYIRLFKSMPSFEKNDEQTEYWRQRVELLYLALLHKVFSEKSLNFQS